MQTADFVWDGITPLPLAQPGWPNTIYGVRLVALLADGQTAAEAYANTAVAFTVNVYTLGMPTLSKVVQVDGPNAVRLTSPAGMTENGAYRPALAQYAPAAAEPVTFRVTIYESIREAEQATASAASGLSPTPTPVPAQVVTVEAGIPITQGAPTTLTAGADITNASAVAVEIASTDGTSTINGTGTTTAWVLPPGATNPNQWVPVIDDVNAFTVGGLTKIGFSATAIGVQGGRYALRFAGAGLTGGGTTVTLTYTTQV